jgi:hypothetical protein
MPISLITTDYSGRTKDLHIMQGVAPNGVATISPSFGKISNFCTGIQKLIQRYTICLLTAITSQPNFPAFGTNFIPTLVNGSVRFNKGDISTLFNFANADVIRLFRDYQRKTSGLPEDEQLNTASLDSISVIDNNVYMTIKLVPVATPAVTFVVPLPS